MMNMYRETFVRQTGVNFTGVILLFPCVNYNQIEITIIEISVIASESSMIAP
jgi:hypothetical protein